MSSESVEHAREMILELADEFVDGGRDLALPFLEGLATDLENIWLVPPERQAQFLERMRLQALALPELGRLYLINISREGFTRAIIAAIRFALRVIA